MSRNICKKKKNLTTVDVCFPIDHPVSKCINMTTVKVSFRTLPNMAKVVSRLNKKIQQKLGLEGNR